MSTTPRKKILFLTNSQYGEAQVVIAVSHELLRRGHCDVHIASHSALSGRVKELDDGAFGASPKESSSVVFHEFSGLSMHETRTKKFGINDIHHKPGVRGALGTFIIPFI
jgi:UDP:flavonoid glycosyltransferase YjiC (YdhE family)